MKLIDVRTADGSRHFACLRRTATWQAVGGHLALLPGAEVLNFIVHGVAEAWLDFAYHQHRFSIRQHGEECWFSVRDPQCSDLRLYQVAAHFEALLGDSPQ
jgi:hypothetical protein